MPISKKTRILLLIAVDAAFFILEIVIGYTAHSLALVADAFHMLNDIISLCVGYWATDVAENKSSSSDYTYGWARAEILGGFVNGVFLIALCVTIVLEAIQRFFEIQEVSNPKLVLIVGGVGLAFNIMGLFLFHQHDHGDADGHSHDGHNHDELDSAEAGHAGHDHAGHDHAVSEGTANVEEQHDHEHDLDHDHDHDHDSYLPAKAKSHKRGNSVTFKELDAQASATSDEVASTGVRRGSMSSRSRSRRSNSRNYDSIENLPIYPAALRNDMRAQARMEEPDSGTESEEAVGATDADNVMDEQPSQVTPLLNKKGISKRKSSGRKSHSRSKQGENGTIIDHHNHKHSQPAQTGSKSSHGHSHDDNVRGMFLHVLGDALGNVGVMASALIIWLSSWKYRFYFDPVISLFITLIILKSAIPLVRDTAKPLLQATPEQINVEDIREDIESLPGIRSCHHIHVWALTRSKVIATLDVQLDFEIEGTSGTARYMELAKAIKKCLHGYNIHNSTVQPEFCTDAEHGDGNHSHNPGLNRQESQTSAHTIIPYKGEEGHKKGNGDGNVPLGGKKSNCGDGGCLLEDNCEGMGCCTPNGGSGTATPKDKKKDGHGHGHGHEH